LLRCPMNVNATLICMRVLSLKPAQPDDACSDWVATRSVWLQDFAGGPPVVEDRADGYAVTDLLLNCHVTQRSCHSSPGISQTEHGGGDRIRSHFPAVLDEHKLLITHANDTLTVTI